MPHISLYSIWRQTPWLLIVLGLVAQYQQWFEVINPILLQALPYIFGAILLSVSVMFHRSRLGLVAIVLLGVYWVIQDALQTEMTSAVYWRFQALHLCAIGCLLIAALLPEKGIKHPLFGIATFAMLGVFFVVWNGVLGGWLAASLASLPEMTAAWSEDKHWISHALLWLFAGMALLVFGWASWRQDAASRSCLLAAVAMFLVVWGFDRPYMSAVMFSSVFLAMMLIFLQDNYQITYMDALTGIPGRRSLEDYLPTLGRRYAIAMLDVDHFKKFNDTHGHDVGDQVLKLVASQVNRVQGGGKAFRYGGEEFTIVFPRSDAASSYVFLEAVREAIANYQMVLREGERHQDSEEARKLRGKKGVKRDQTISVTISIGVASSAAGCSAADIIKKADEALYAAKQNGRNQTVRADALPQPKNRARQKKAA